MTVKPIALALALGAAVWTFASAQTKSQDPNLAMSSRKVLAGKIAAQRVFDQVLANKEALAAPGEVCAIAVIPGPADLTDILVSILNIATDRDSIGDLTLDPFGALGGQGLIISSVSALAAPANGTATLDYPTGPTPSPSHGRGPAVITYTSFGLGESSLFIMDPDTNGNPDFGPTVEQMSGTVLELAYVNGKRCRGVFMFNTVLNASLALPVQVNP
jgi:hypothetical protein